MKPKPVGLLALAAVVLGLAATALLPPRDRSRDPGDDDPGPRSGREGPRAPHLDPAAVARRVVGSQGVSTAEQAAIDAAIGRKMALRRTLSEHSSELFEVAMDPDATDERIREALDEFSDARADAERLLKEIDGELVAKVSTRTRAKLTTSGILDNGLGFMAAGRRNPPGMAGAAGPFMPPSGDATPPERAR